MAIYPSKEWVIEVLKAAEKSEAYKEAAEIGKAIFCAELRLTKNFSEI